MPFALVSKSDFKDLEISLIKLLPLSSQMVTLIRMAEKSKFPKAAEIRFYLYRDEEQEARSELENIFIVCIQIPNIFSPHCVISFCPQNPSFEMIEAFDNLIDWKHVNLFSQNNVGFSSHLRVLCKKHGNRSETPEGIPGRIFFLDPEIALAIPENIRNQNLQIKSISSEFVPQVMKNWKMGKSGSEERVEDAIKILPSIGIFVDVDSDSDSELASSALMSTMGLINVVFTEEKYRRKGLGALTIEGISKSIASMGWIPGAETEMGNHKSQAMLEKVGFKMAFDTFWFFFEK